jgi:hypothetical protein
MESLSDRLKSLGFKPASTLQPAVKAENKSLEEIISAEVNTNSLGSFLVRFENYLYGYQQGKITFSEEIYSEKLNQAARLMRSDIPLRSMVFLDTETSGLSGGTGTFAFLVGIGSFNDLGFQLQQFIIRDPAEESAMLLHLSNSIHPDSVFVTFNGKSFDIPLLSNRLVVNRIPANFRENPHVDVLHLSRKIWRNQLPSCSLKDLEREVLSMERSDEEVPGWMIPEIYFDYLRTGNADRLSNVIYHNAQDIVSLAALFIYISEMLEKNVSIDTYTLNDLIAIGRIFLDIGSVDLAKQVFLNCLKRTGTIDEKIAVNNLLGKIYKTEHKSRDAVEYWVEAGNSGNLEACIELAMHYEHQSGDPISALQWAEKAAAIISADANQQCSKSVKMELEKRIHRLNGKVSKNVL